MSGASPPAPSAALPLASSEAYIPVAGHPEAPLPVAAVARRNGFRSDLVILALSSATLLAAALLDTRAGTQVVVPVLGMPIPELCSLRRIFGIECPGCGLTRSFIAMMHGDLASAWRYNAAGIAVFAAVACQLPYRIWHLSRRNHPYPPRRLAALNWAWLVIGAALLIQWIARLAS